MRRIRTLILSLFFVGLGAAVSSEEDRFFCSTSFASNEISSQAVTVLGDLSIAITVEPADSGEGLKYIARFAPQGNDFCEAEIRATCCCGNFLEPVAAEEERKYCYEIGNCEDGCLCECS